jgi:pyruvate,orthophosphate dikinase
MNRNSRNFVMSTRMYFRSTAKSFLWTHKQEQLKDCIKAVFGSWFFSWAVKYREINKIRNLIGTAANVQMMVFGNMGNDSGTAIAFSCNPSTGANELYGKYLINAQGEDVVAGIHTPQPISQMHDVLPNAYKQFVANINKLEKHFKQGHAGCGIHC